VSQPLLQAVGVLESCFKEKFGTPRQPNLVPDATAKLRIRAKFIPEQSLKGLEEFSHVWLLAYFHLNTNTRFVSTIHPPRLEGKTVGVFASRAPHRPSPIGLSVARLVKVEGDTLHLSELDLVDGTPIVDVKPYIPAYDSVPKAVPGWTARVGARELDVEFTAEAAAQARKLEPKNPGLRRLIEGVLRQDLRNPRDKSQLKDGKPFETFLYDLMIGFVVKKGVATVTAVVPAPKAPKPRVPVPPALLS
jgi:tRNA-Thr(GGU) m(6)t(6)A37 methyltransferase TsaA